MKKLIIFSQDTQKTKRGVKIKESDHNSIITKVNVSFIIPKNTNTVEMYNFKDSEGLLKNNKSRDPLGFPNKLFKTVNAGDDLKCAILIMMNKIKRTQKFLKY